MSFRHYVRPQGSIAMEMRVNSVRLLVAGAALAVVAALSATGARAQEEGMRSERMRSEIAPRSLMKDEVFGVKPQVGVLLFRPAINGRTTGETPTEARGLVGVTTDINVVKLLGMDSRMPWYGGISTGALASHVGARGANFLGMGDVGGGSNFVIIPANLKVGLNVNDNFRVSLHGGANATFRSVTNGFNFTTAGAEQRDIDPSWNFFPNVGADFEFGDRIAILVRPDYTFTPEDDYFTGSIALAIPMG